ncbi:AEC family transporter [Puniceibacterium sp. IMCC21224]|uniref:AEC family transporter n=1 Tax=Puniceibacterium sp. IMCC21224 TaxID=1618204 RepID=UPI00064DBA0A|nr:AEC family transporter [Puniceibacterium sp. IMCC21224]KMK66865.1 putative permease [Puniceibacterium sp. IMCC21224]
MFDVLTGNILPVFSVLALGFLLGRIGMVSGIEARAINRVSFIVFQPPLIFLLIARIDVASFPVRPLALYACAEIVAFVLTYQIARRIFGREVAEAWLLAMAVVFVNSLLYIWPISVLIYGLDGVTSIGAIVAWDSTVAFAFFIISIELLSGDRGAGAAVASMSRNPVLLAILLAVLTNLIALPLPAPLVTALDFAGAAAPPLTLFAVGVILSASPLVPTPVVITIAGLKLVLFPLMVWALISQFSPGDPAAPQFILNAAGPSGMMAFSLALLHGVRSDAITPVIIWTCLLSLIPLALLA